MKLKFYVFLIILICGIHLFLKYIKIQNTNNIINISLGNLESKNMDSDISLKNIENNLLNKFINK
jgi:hypothetical protein